MKNTAEVGSLREPRLWVLAAVVAVVVAALVYSVYGERQRTALRVGEVSPQAFVAPVDTQVVDRIATERERQAARLQIEAVFSSDPELQQLVTAAVTSSGLPADVIDSVVRAYRDPNGVRFDEVAQVIAGAVAMAPADRAREARLVLERRLVATSVPNSKLTEAARSAAAAAVQPVLQSLRAGQTIIAVGDRLTEDNLRVLETLGLYSVHSAERQQNLWIGIGSVLLGMLFAVPLLYARHALIERVKMSQLTSLVVLTLVVLVGQRLASLGNVHFLFILLVPLVVTVLVSETAGLLWAVWIALAAALLAPAAFHFVLVASLVGAVVACRTVQMVHTRVASLLAGATGGLAAGLTLMVLVLVGGGLPLGSAAVSAGTLFAAGAIAGVVALGLLPLAESSFGFLTDYRLLELSSPTSPLLQRLLIEAPGTYQHSLIISNLVEQAVKNIGGNALLARVGALYHDVGKMRRPHFFVENQFSGDNPHDHLSPHLSYLIITSHVRDGVEILREARMPREIEPFAASHHGTTVLSYFYKRALEESANVEELNFRYAGPKPRTKETAVLMLADSVESASRTLAEPSQSSIRAMIERLIDQRLQDDQLTESPLNFHDVEVITNTFERMLTAILHRRISYPSAEEIKGLRRGSGDPRRDAAVPATATARPGPRGPAR